MLNGSICGNGIERTDVLQPKPHSFAIVNTMDSLLSRITVDPAISHGKPSVRGLRYSVEMLLDLLSSGMTFEEILADYEDLEREDLLAVLAFAAKLARTRRLQPVAS